MNGNIYSQKNMSQEDVILLHLIKHGKISNKDCNNIYGFTHLPSVIRYLRKKNIKIVNDPQEILGHSSVSVTERYTHTNAKSKKSAIELLCS